MMHHRKLLLAALALLPMFFGCGGPSVDVVPVSGLVKINGEPTEGVGVVFQPVTTGQNATEAPQSSGVTDASGRFVLSISITEQKGALPGRHRVMFMAGVYPKDAPDGAPPAYEPIPPKYNVDSQETFEVPDGGTDQAEFNLDIPDFKRTP
jgi:hypothetical protein